VSLASRVTALAQAIGADIKALKLGQSAFQIGGWSPGQNLAAGWNTMDLYQQYAQISPAGAFTLGPNYVTVNQDGWYSISAGAVINGGNVYTVSLGTAPATEGYISESSGNVVGGLVTVASSAVFLPAGTKVYVTVWVQTATTGGVRYFSIGRIGGPKGDPGPAGPAGSIPVYEQTTQPVTSQIGAIWIKG
jgi:hypothetical protein